MAFSFPLRLLLPTLNRKLVLFIRITTLNWPLLGYPHARPHFPLPSSRHILLPKIPKWPQSKERWRVLKAGWTDNGGCFLDGETEARRAQSLVQNTCASRFPSHCLFLVPWLLSLLFQPPFSRWQVFTETFPIIKGIWEKPGRASSALKPVGPSWPFNCAWKQPSSQLLPLQKSGRAQSRIPPPSCPFGTKGDLSAFVSDHFIARASRAPTHRASKSGGLRVKYNHEQTLSLGFGSVTLETVFQKRSHSLLNPTVA